jgi:hypothetical protein
MVQVVSPLIVHRNVTQDAALEVELHDQETHLFHGGAHRQDLREQAVARLLVARLVHAIHHALNAPYLALDAAEAGFRLLCDRSLGHGVAP